MNATKSLIFVALALILGVPFVFSLVRDSGQADPGARTLTIITPHNEQIRYEFERGFNEWHQNNYGEPVVIDWRTPGGTSTIRKQLQSIYTKAISTGKITPEGELARDEQGNPTMGVMPNDIFFGGGSYEHGQMKNGVTATPLGADEAVNMPISVQIDISEAELATVFGENVIGADELYDPELYWLGTALSGFGIVFNRDVLDMLDLPEPRGWHDLTDAGYTGWMALADPRMSGSVTTTYDSILNIYGWDEGWRILRDMCANARYFAITSTKIPIDVSIGEAAAGVAIDFYGRYQSQALMQPGETAETARVGYSYPPGAVLIDADPVSILRGGPDPELARRFVDYVLSPEGQSIWQYHARRKLAGLDTGDAVKVAIPEGFGPEQYELRRLPVRRDMYVPEHTSRFVDADTNPFVLAGEIEYQGWRSAIAPLMAAMAIENQSQIRDAWIALNELRAAADENNALAPTVAEAEALFYAFPEHTFPDNATDRDGNPSPYAGQTVAINGENFRAIRAQFWDGSSPTSEQRIRYLRFFRENYAEVVRIAEDALANAV